MDFNWINLALTEEHVAKRTPATPFTFQGHVIATDRARIHVWTDPDAAMFCNPDTAPLNTPILSNLLRMISTAQPVLLMDERQDEHWKYIQILDGSWVFLNLKFYEEARLPYPNSIPVILDNGKGSRMVSFKGGNCMSAVMEVKA